MPRHSRYLCLSLYLECLDTLDRIGHLPDKSMNEEEFDSLIQGRPFGTADFRRLETQAGRCTHLAVALWGRTFDDLQRQLLAPYPQLPSGFELADFRKLQHWVQLISARCVDLRFALLPRFDLFSSTISIGAQQFTEWEARGEIVRRAIEYLEKG